jgi:hypothetical protein
VAPPPHARGIPRYCDSLSEGNKALSQGERYRKAQGRFGISAGQSSRHWPQFTRKTGGGGLRLPMSLVCTSRFQSFPSPVLSPGLSRGVASQGQKRSLPVVSHPHAGQRRTCRSRWRNGTIGMNRKRKKNGNPRYHIRTVAASDTASSIRLVLHAFIVHLSG